MKQPLLDEVERAIAELPGQPNVFSLPADEMERLNRICHLIWIDHHKSEHTADIGDQNHDPCQDLVFRLIFDRRAEHGNAQNEPRHHQGEQENAVARGERAQSHADTHQDHRALSKAAVSATRYIKNVLFYEGPTTQQFSPNVFVDINETMEDKISMLLAHHSQVTKTNIEGLSIADIARSTAVFRGIQGRVHYAEGFIPLRYFIRMRSRL